MSEKHQRNDEQMQSFEKKIPKNCFMIFQKFLFIFVKCKPSKNPFVNIWSIDKQTKSSEYPAKTEFVIEDENVF